MNSYAYRTLLAVTAIGAALAVPAFAGEVSHQERHCGWTREGAYACSSKSESDESKTSRLCISNSYDTYCKTTTTPKEPKPEPEPEYVAPTTTALPTLDADAYQRAKEREAENLKKGRTGVVVCGADHWVRDHWEPSCR